MAQRPCCTDDYGPVVNWLLLIMRIVVSVLMLAHGIPKFVQLFMGNFDFPDPIGLGPALSLTLAVFAEFYCSLFILVGYRSRFFAIPLIFLMLIALLIVHGSEPVFDHVNILLYLLAYILILQMGGGKYSLTFYLAEKDKKNRKMTTV